MSADVITMTGAFFALCMAMFALAGAGIGLSVGIVVGMVAERIRVRCAQ